MNRDDHQLLIRADVGPNVGTGHVMRCIALGQAWKKLGGKVAFACGDMPRGLQHRIHREGFRHFEISNSRGCELDAKDTNEIVATMKPDWLVLDGYRMNDAYQAMLTKGSTRMLVIDDFGHGAHESADLVLNQNAYAHPADYVCKNTMLGTQFLLMRREFQEPQPEDRSCKTPPFARNILISFGGSDPENWTLRALELLSHEPSSGFNVDVVLGPGYSHHQSLAQFKRESNLNVRVHRNVDRMSHLMKHADLCITAGGSTCYELARCGVPSFIISIAENQIQVALELQRRDIGLYAGHHATLDFVSTRQALVSLVKSASARQKMSAAGIELIDGQGANRIARAMASKLFTLRPAKIEDAEIIHQWRNNPEVRAVSFQEKAIPFESHRQWLQEKLESDRCLIWIAQDKNGNRMGQIRFDLAAESEHAQIRATSSATISVIVAPQYRGRGAGTMLIEKACSKVWDRMPLHNVTALIKPSNSASQIAFRKAGFKPMPPTVVNGTTAIQMCLLNPDSSFDSTVDLSNLKKSA